MRSMEQFGNDLYTGKLSLPFIPKRKLWLIISTVLLILAALVPVFKPMQLSIEFTGGSQFVVSNVQELDPSLAHSVMAEQVPDATAMVTTVGENQIRVKSDQLTDPETRAVATALAQAYDVPEAEVATTFVGPSWGEDVTRQSLIGLVIFLILTFIILAVYFRTWKMSTAAMIGVVYVLVLAVGIYALFGFEISPAAVIGFLTILSYSLYDTTVVFDKIRENTKDDGKLSPRTYGESVNLAVNQTLVRSINTTVVAILPVAAILFLGVFWLGAQTLSSISLAIFIGIIVAAYSTLFVAAPLYSVFRETEAQIKKTDARVLEARAKASAEV